MGEVVNLHISSGPDEVLVYPTTYTQPDGQFSPAIMVGGKCFLNGVISYADENKAAADATDVYKSVVAAIENSCHGMGYREQ